VNGSDNKPIRLILAEDHHVVRSALASYLRSKPWIDVVGELSDGRNLIEIVERERPDVLVMDAEMPAHQPVAVVKHLSQSCPETRVLVLSAHDSPDYVVGLFQAGVAGYVLKNDPSDALIQALNMVAQGRQWISPRAAAVLAGYVRSQLSDTGTARLSEREMQVLALMARGYRNEDIANELVLSEHTVRNHIASIFHKLGVETRVSAVLFAIASDIVPFEEIKKKYTSAAAH
jgi:DNA-binding NarL/FixJ family response regulator